MQRNVSDDNLTGFFVFGLLFSQRQKIPVQVLVTFDFYDSLLDISLFKLTPDSAT